MMMLQSLKAHRAADPDVSIQPTSDAKKAVQEFKQEAANSQGNFQDDFKTSEKFPLGDSPVLAHKLVYKVEGSKLVLTIEPRSGKGITIVLDAQLNFNVSKLLKSASESAKWELDWDEQPASSPTRVIN